MQVACILQTIRDNQGKPWFDRSVYEDALKRLWPFEEGSLRAVLDNINQALIDDVIDALLDL